LIFHLFLLYIWNLTQCERVVGRTRRFLCFYKHNTKHIPGSDIEKIKCKFSPIFTQINPLKIQPEHALLVYIFACYKFSRVLNFASFLVNFREIQYCLNFSKLQNREIKYTRKIISQYFVSIFTSKTLCFKQNQYFSLYSHFLKII